MRSTSSKLKKSRSTSKAARSRLRMAAPSSAAFPDSAAQSAVEAETPDPDITPAEAVERSRKLIINATPKITEGVIVQAKEGSYLHARMLFDFAGLTAVQPPEAASVSPVLEVLMKELEKPLLKPALS